MAVISFVKALPTTHVFHFANGRIRRSGRGLSFFYYTPNSTIVLVPLQSVDLPFAFLETTADFQQITVQGQFTFKVKDPLALAELFDFSVDPEGRYTSEDPEKLKERLLHTVQVITRSLCQSMELKDVLKVSDGEIASLHQRIAEAPTITGLGVDVTDYTITAIKPSPDMARALEAGTREALSREADEALYQRRNAAVDQERAIKENELQTELMVEEKKRVISEAKWAASIAEEIKRGELVDNKIQNDRKEADSKAYGLNAVLEPLKGVDWKLLTAALGHANPQMMIATAFRELAENAAKIGQLNLTPELLAALSVKK